MSTPRRKPFRRKVSFISLSSCTRGRYTQKCVVSKYQFNYLIWIVMTIEISWTKIKNQNQVPHLLLQYRLVGIADWPVQHDLMIVSQMTKNSIWGDSILHKVSWKWLSNTVEFIFYIWCRTGWWPACTVLLKISGTLNMYTVYTLYLVPTGIR